MEVNRSRTRFTGHNTCVFRRDPGIQNQSAATTSLRVSTPGGRTGSRCTAPVRPAPRARSERRETRAGASSCRTRRRRRRSSRRSRSTPHFCPELALCACRPSGHRTPGGQALQVLRFHGTCHQDAKHPRYASINSGSRLREMVAARSRRSSLRYSARRLRPSIFAAAFLLPPERTSARWM